MQKITKNGINVSKMTLGTVQLGMNYGVNNKNGMPTEEESFAILDAAYEGGVTILDTSDDYGKSEEVIGKYLQMNPDKHFDICTKFRVTEETSKDIYASLKDFAIKSAKKLSIERIPIFMSHTEKNFLDYGDRLIEALNELKKEGLIINAGISLSNKDALEPIMESGGFEAIQLPMNILDNEPIRNGLIKRVSDSGIAVFVRSVYLQGIFFKKREDLLVQDPERPELNQKILPVIEKIGEIAAEEGISVAQLAVSFIKDSCGVDSLVMGSETPEQVAENIKMFNAPSLSESTLKRIRDEFSDVDPFIISPWLWKK